MPSFASTQNTSGPASSPANGRGGRGSNIESMADGGIANRTSVNVAIINGSGVGPAYSPTRWTGPNYGTSWEPEFNSARDRFKGSFSISGITKDSTGTPIASCDVELFQTGSEKFLGRTTSDGSGNYSFVVPTNSGNFWVRAYKVGAPDVAGTTINNIVAV
jgi:hypothetical protein